MELFSQEYFERAVRHTVPSDAPETLIQKTAADMTRASKKALRVPRCGSMSGINTPADEADSYRRGKGSSNGFTLTQNIYAAKQTPVELAASTAAYFQRTRWAL